jgi:8-oxo-dGTP pyrophosphatase MutT (NUDIX family)
MQIKELAVVLFVLPDHRVILQRRTKDAPKNPGLLGMYGGHVERGETTDEAVRREIEEETSLIESDLVITKCVVHEIAQDGEVRRYTVYRADVQDEDFETYEGEHKEVYPVSELLSRSDLAPYVKDVIRKIGV